MVGFRSNSPCSFDHCVRGSFDTGVAAAKVLRASMLCGGDRSPVSVGQLMGNALRSRITAGAGVLSLMLSVRYAFPLTVYDGMVCILSGTVSANGTGLGTLVLCSGMGNPIAIGESVILSIRG